MPHNDPYMKIFKSIMESVSYIKKVDSQREMEDAYIDNYVTKQQRLRDKKITELLNTYVSTYQKKCTSNMWYKNILFGSCSIILIVFSIVFVCLICKIDFTGDVVPITSLVEVISVCITFLSLIIGILQIITKYVFPENEDEYITKIVEIIQNNDLENKKENIRAKVEIMQDKQVGADNVTVEIMEEL